VENLQRIFSFNYYRLGLLERFYEQEKGTILIGKYLFFILRWCRYKRIRSSMASFSNGNCYTR
jgi:hypothetical protein